MIDPSALLLGTSAASLVASFFSKSIEELGKKTADAAWDKASRVVEFLKRELSPEPRKLLAALEVNPQNEQTKKQLESAIAETVSTNPQFAKELSTTLVQAADSGVDTIFNTNISGNVEKLVQIQTIVGSVTI
jgi:hypothetical protein